MTPVTFVHLRAEMGNVATLCGANPREGSQSLFGLRLQQWRIYRHIPAPRDEDYCPKCLAIYRGAQPAFDAMLRLQTEVKP